MIQVHRLCYTGVLAPPKNVSLKLTPQTLQLTWEPPYSLDITNVEPDILNYIVHILVHTTDSDSATETSTTVSAYNSQYTVVREHPQSCKVMEFTVSAVNAAGESNVSNPAKVSVGGM